MPTSETYATYEQIIPIAEEHKAPQALRMIIENYHAEEFNGVPAGDIIETSAQDAFGDVFVSPRFIFGAYVNFLVQTRTINEMTPEELAAYEPNF